MASPIEDLKRFGNAAKAFCKLKILEGLTRAVRQIREIAGDFDNADIFEKDSVDDRQPKIQSNSSPKKRVSRSGPAKKRQKEEPTPPTLVFETWSKAALYQKAKELEIPGRSKMDKKALITAIRRHTH